MRDRNAFWAGILILAGILFLLSNFGVLGVNVWSLLWPLFLIGLGAWIIWGFMRPRPLAEAKPGSVALQEAARARVEINHGAGELRVSGGAGELLLAEGTFGGGLEQRSIRRGDLLEAKLSVPGGVIAMPFNWAQGGLDWDVRLNGDIPIDLECHTGASKSVIDLHDLKITSFELETGASKTEVILPAHADYTIVKIEVGAASVDLRVPGGVAARIRTESGLSSVQIDPTRFPGSGNRYESPDYATAVNKVDIKIETGVGSVTIN